MYNSSPRCPGCGSADVAIRGSAPAQNDPSPVPGVGVQDVWLRFRLPARTAVLVSVEQADQMIE